MHPLTTPPVAGPQYGFTLSAAIALNYLSREHITQFVCPTVSNHFHDPVWSSPFNVHISIGILGWGVSTMAHTHFHLLVLSR